MAEVDATLEDVEVEHESDIEETMGSAMSARDDGEVGRLVDMVREVPERWWRVESWVQLQEGLLLNA